MSYSSRPLVEGSLLELVRDTAGLNDSMGLLFHNLVVKANDEPRRNHIAGLSLSLSCIRDPNDGGNISAFSLMHSEQSCLRSSEVKNVCWI